MSKVIVLAVYFVFFVLTNNTVILKIDDLSQLKTVRCFLYNIHANDIAEKESLQRINYHLFEVFSRFSKEFVSRQGNSLKMTVS